MADTDPMAANTLVTPLDAGDSPDVREAPDPAVPPKRSLFRRWIAYLRARRFDWLDLLVLTSVFVAGTAAAGLITQLMLADEQIRSIAGQPIWDKVATSYFGFLLYFMHLRVVMDARDLRREPETAAPGARAGNVSPGDLLGLAVVMLAVETIFLANVGQLRLAAWGIAIIFSAGVYLDFGLGRLVRGRPLARSAIKALAYPLVMAMLVAATWESVVTLGLFGGGLGLDLSTGKQYPGLQPGDLFTIQPLALWMLYGAVFGLAWAWELHRTASQSSTRTFLSRFMGLAGAGLLAALAFVLMPGDQKGSLGPEAAAAAAGVAGLAWALWPARRWGAGRSVLMALLWAGPAVVFIEALNWLGKQPPSLFG